MNRLVICLSIASLALAGCGSDPDPDPTAASPKPAAKSAPSADPLERMAHAVGNGKPGAAVLIRYDFASKPAVGTPTELQIAFIPQAGVDSLDIVIGSIDGVTLSGPLTASFTEVVSSKPYMHTVTVLPDRAGVFYHFGGGHDADRQPEPEPDVRDPVRGWQPGGQTEGGAADRCLGRGRTARESPGNHQVGLKPDR